MIEDKGTIESAFDCALICSTTNLCTEFYFTNDGTNQCHLYKAPCSDITQAIFDNYKMEVITDPLITYEYQDWFDVTTANPACGFKQYWLGGCDAGGYDTVKYIDPDDYQASMPIQTAIISGSGKRWWEFQGKDIQQACDTVDQNTLKASEGCADLVEASSLTSFSSEPSTIDEKCCGKSILFDFNSLKVATNINYYDETHHYNIKLQ